LALAQIWCNSDRADQTGLEKINVCPAAHLAFDGLELDDLTFCPTGSSLTTPLADETTKLERACAIHAVSSASTLLARRSRPLAQPSSTCRSG
jgi:hypothetical protein